MTKLSLIPYFLFIFEYLDFDVIPFTLRVEDYERHSKPYLGKYAWLGPDLTQNTRGRYIPILPEVRITLNFMVLLTGPKLA